MIDLQQASSAGASGGDSRRRVLVTGASSGIGRAVAEHLLARGYEVWGTSRDPAHMEDIPGLHPVVLDLADRTSIRDAAATVLGDGGVDVLVNNAGSGWFGPLEHADAEVLESQFQILVLGPTQLTRAMLSDLHRRRGMVINITSLGGPFPIPFMGPYSAAKMALSTLTDVWQMEISEDDVAFVDIQPGDLPTAFNDGLGPERWAGDAGYGDNSRRAFAVMDGNVRSGPDPAVVAKAVERFIVRGGHGRSQEGMFFQRVFGPLAARLLPRGVLLRQLRKRYRME